MEDSALVAQRHFTKSPSGSSTGIVRDFWQPCRNRTIAGLLETGDELILPLSDRLERLILVDTDHCESAYRTRLEIQQQLWYLSTRQERDVFEIHRDCWKLSWFGKTGHHINEPEYVKALYTSQRTYQIDNRNWREEQSRDWILKWWIEEDNCGSQQQLGNGF